MKPGWTHLLFVLTLYAGHANCAVAGPCSCPEKDAFAKPKCAPIPKSLDEVPTRWRFPKKTASCLNPDLASTIDPLILDLTHHDTKTKEQLLNYARCYVPDRNAFCHFKNSVFPYLTLGVHIGFSPIVQACHFLRESRYDPAAKSTFTVENKITKKKEEKHAYGTIQFTDVAIIELNKVLSKSQKQYASEISKIEKKLKRKKLSLENRAYLKKVKGNLSRFKEARRIWNEYWKGTKGAPKKVSMKFAKCPQTAYAMAAMKESLDRMHLLGMDGKTYQAFAAVPKFRSFSATEFEILNTGAYNGGPGLITKYCRRAQTLKACIQALKFKYGDKFEMVQHMVGVSNCVKPNSSDPIHDVYDPKAKKKCDDQRCY